MRIRVEDLSRDPEPSIECLLTDAFPDGQDDEVRDELLRRGETIYGGGAAPAYRIVNLDAGEPVNLLDAVNARRAALGIAP